MIKRLHRCLLGMLLVCLLAACDEKSEVFYTTTYDVGRMEVNVTFQAATPLKPANPGTKNTAGGDEADPTPDEEEGPDAPGDDTPGPSITALIQEQVLAEAPVKVGGSYSLEYKHFDTGFLTVRPSAGEEPLAGAFSRTPEASTLYLHLPDRSYTLSVASYRYGTTSLTQFRADLTEQFQRLYPNHMIQRVERIEYTSHPY